MRPMVALFVAAAAAALVHLQDAPWNLDALGGPGPAPGPAPVQEPRKRPAESDDPVAATLAALLGEAARGPAACASGRGPVVVGFNGNLDLVARADDLARALLASGRLGADDLAATRYRGGGEDISSPAELYAAIGHYLRLGAAVERFGRDQALFDELSEAAAALPGSEFHIGGNAAIMSERLASLGCEVSFAAPAGPRLRGLQHARVRPVGGEGSAPPRDDVHLILEYAAGRFLPEAGEATAAWQAGRANRFIFTRHSDLVRPDELVRNATGAAARPPAGLVLSGFHLLDGRPSESRDRLVAGFERLLGGLDRAATLSHVEVASMSEPALVDAVLRRVLGRSRSAGANEQELAAMADVLRRGRLNPDGYDTRPEAGAALREVAALMRATGLERFHLHSLAYQAVCVRRDSPLAAAARASAVAASLAASSQACAAAAPEALRPGELRLLEEVADPSRPVRCGGPPGADGDELLCCLAPVLVCREPRRTVGLGDHISAAALAVYL